jgi:hypothetical protein
MPYQYRQVLELRFLQGCSIKNCGAELGHRVMRSAAQINGEDQR